MVFIAFSNVSKDSKNVMNFAFMVTNKNGNLINTIYLFIYLFTYLFRAALAVVYGSFPARGGIRSAAASLHHSHCNVGSEPRLQPTPQLMATSDP